MKDKLDEVKSFIERELANKSDIIAMKSIIGGRNNRAYCIETTDKHYFVKLYNKSWNNQHDRLKSEYYFLLHAQLSASQYVSTPIKYDESLSLGIYEFIPGSKYNLDNITANSIEHAIDFIKKVNQHRFMPSAYKIGHAAEACYKIADHLQLIENRINRLRAIEIEDDIDEIAHDFIHNDIIPLWNEMNSSIQKSVADLALNTTNALNDEDKILSPSDFGFHNAIMLPDKSTKFVDFEYAGWDDPAKLVCDFFNQIEIPVPHKHLRKFAHEIASIIENGEEMLIRIKLLYPFYQIKWICIVLNYFIKSIREKKEFVSNVTINDKIAQLNKAKLILSNIGKVNKDYII